MKEPPHPRWRTARCAMSAIRSLSSPPRPASRRRAPPTRWSSTMTSCRRSSASSMPSSAARRFCSTTCRTICARLGARRQSGDRRGIPQGGACGAHQPGQQPPRRQSDGAARGNRRIQCGDWPLYALDHEPIPARRPPADGRVRPQHSATQVTDRGAGRRRRLRRETIPLCRRSRDHLGYGQSRQADQMGVRAQRRFHFRRARPRSCD